MPTTILPNLPNPRDPGTLPSSAAAAAAAVTSKATRRGVTQLTLQDDAAASAFPAQLKRAGAKTAEAKPGRSEEQKASTAPARKAPKAHETKKAKPVKPARKRGAPEDDAPLADEAAADLTEAAPTDAGEADTVDAPTDAADEAETAAENDEAHEKATTSDDGSAAAYVVAAQAGAPAEAPPTGGDRSEVDPAACGPACDAGTEADTAAGVAATDLAASATTADAGEAGEAGAATIGQKGASNAGAPRSKLAEANKGASRADGLKNGAEVKTSEPSAATPQAALPDAVPPDVAAAAQTTPPTEPVDPKASGDAGEDVRQMIDALGRSVAAAGEGMPTHPAPGGAAAGVAASAAPGRSEIPPEARFAETNHASLVSSMRTQLMPNGGTMRIRLDPPQLGALQVTVHMRDGVMTAAFETSTDEATKLLSHSLTQLKHVLEAQGVNVEKLQVQQGPRETQSAGRNDNQQQEQPGGGQQREATRQEQQEHQRREMMRRMWRRLSGGGGDPLDVTG